MAVLPNSTPYLDAVLKSADVVVSSLDDAQALIWTGSDQTGFPSCLPPAIEWVQLKSAGVKPWIDSGRVDSKRRWTSAVGAYSADVAEHAVALLLGSLRQFTLHARANSWLKDSTWSTVRSLRGRTVAIVGAGSIDRSLIPLLKAHGARVIAINRSGREVEGAERTVSSRDLDEALAEADDAVLAGASTDETLRIIGQKQLAALGSDPRDGTPGVLINIARGDLVDHAALTDALRRRIISGAGLDVFDPEPLPAEDPLWGMDNVLITPHVANPRIRMLENFADLVQENLRRFACGRELKAEIDLSRSY
ncbi:D-isomer specific 2-hydroxyacid dehydrogenase family protein [Brevibacterium spongiae]|uniref:D-isomer specific 2-hydroxyacid dehydrogenase family protein n=1 Tax=Brevibacterium spongiae TaxID=2909672 RepID=A0ABY5STH9_9MICO|nr:D-isomer specific 2-hydroxyacid dehydrogenase family protein [Brevibacterium spongiae]UVI36336.1 D-isomer specific 2-hydroxyacid dehydrogenase family protein [Brevibacterium spongiae]